MLLVFAHTMLSGFWAPSPPVTTPTCRDINGVIVNVGDIVRVECIIQSIEYTDDYHGMLNLGVLHPNWNSAQGPPLPSTPNLPPIRVDSLGVIRN